VRPLLLISSIFFLLLSGCATVMEGSDQNINIQTLNCDDAVVTCLVSNDDTAATVRPPGTVNVGKSSKPITVECANKDKSVTGRVLVDSGYETMGLGNILLGGIVGVGVDAATGAMWEYPSAVVVPLQCDEDS
jgi:hypothetical protein